MKGGNIIIQGLGGDGVLFFSKILLQIFSLNNINVVGAFTHGISQRGGHVISFIRIDRGLSTIIPVKKADIIIFLNKEPLTEVIDIYANINTSIIINTPVNKIYNIKMKNVFTINSNFINNKNMGVLGYIIAKKILPITLDQAEDIIKKNAPREMKRNILSLYKGYKIGNIV